MQFWVLSRFSNKAIIGLYISCKIEGQTGTFYTCGIRHMVVETR